LLYTRALSDEIDLPLNEMWLASTTIVGEAPITLGLQGVLRAEWSPVISQPLIAYSTAERTPSPPGWRANNDLWLFAPSRPPVSGEAERKAVEVISANTQGLYPWWGSTFVWSPDGTRLAYARADQIGVIEVTSGRPISYTITPLLDFTPFNTFSEWVWVPGISWSPDGQFLAATVHGPPLAAEPAEESQVFDLWLIGVDTGVSAKVSEQVGMWANPAWGTAGIAFGAATNPLQSVNSRYYIQLIDRDGSNRRQLFPFKEELGVQLPELSWSPQGEALLFTYNGNLYIINRDGSPPKQLTSDGQASHPQWVSGAPLITSMVSPAPLTSTHSVTPATPISSTKIISATPAGGGELRLTPAPANSITPTATLTTTPPTITGTTIFQVTPTVRITRTVTITPEVDENKGNSTP
jgi:Tol biopolymer transport system component